jgi:hypothetical protein
LTVGDAGGHGWKTEEKKEKKKKEKKTSSISGTLRSRPPSLRSAPNAAARRLLLAPAAPVSRPYPAFGGFVMTANINGKSGW